MNNLYETLEICLQDIEQGADIETVLFRYPDLADELRPILEASVNAKGMSVLAPSTEVVRRNRAKLLQHAAEMREAKVPSPSRPLRSTSATSNERSRATTSRCSSWTLYSTELLSTSATSTRLTSSISTARPR